MPNIKREDLPKRSVKLTIEIPVDEMRVFLEAAAEEISTHSKIDGFRPGHANYEAVKNSVGEMKIMEAAIEPAVRKTFVEAVMNEKLETAGSPEINVEKMAPGNAFVYTATIPLMPDVEKLGDFSKLSVKKGSSEVKEDEIDKALTDLQKMQTVEVRAAGTDVATKDHKAVIDMSMTKDKVAVEGGEAKGYHVYLSEPNYIPGFAEELIGLKENDTKTFTLKFPKEHYQKHLANGDVEFTVNMKELYQLQPPELNDEFATKLGKKDLAELKEALKTNIKEENEHEEERRLEREMLDAVVKESRFTDIPDLLVNDEVNKMTHELEHHVEEQGMPFDQYLKSIGKTLAQLKMDFTVQALQRIKVMLVLRTIGREKNVVVDAKELDIELDRLAGQHEDKEAKDRIYSPMYREYMEGVMRNKKVIAMLKEAMAK
ncbi:MAG: trigger factor [Patescibacteria group bacterium]